jgi:hypothetical protein
MDTPADALQPPPGKPSLLPEKEEFTCLLKCIEEVCKHARTVLFVLLTACVYVLISAFSASMTGHDIKLPIIAADVKPEEFFLVSPVVILVCYVYLHIYVGELRKLLQVAETFFEGYTFVVPEPARLLYPWILVFALRTMPRGRPSTLLSDRGSISERSISTSYIVLITSLVIWIFGPLVLFVLWLRFIRNEDIVSVVPCISVILALWFGRTTALRSTPRRLVTLLWGTFSASLAIITLASVPVLRTESGLDVVWSVSEVVLQRLQSTTLGWWAWTLIALIVVSFLPYLILVFLRLLGPAGLFVRIRFYRFWYDHIFAEPWDYLFFPSSFILFDLDAGDFGIPQKVHDARFAGADLSSLRFGKEWNFARADLRGTKLRGCDLKGANLSGTNLAKSDLLLAKLDESILQQAVLDGANLRYATLKNARMQAASLRNASLWHADLPEALDLAGADLSGTDLNEAFVPQEDWLQRLQTEANPQGFRASDWRIVHTRELGREKLMIVHQGQADASATA